MTDALAKLSLAQRASVIQNLRRKSRNNTDMMIRYRAQMLDGALGQQSEAPVENQTEDAMLREALVLGNVSISSPQPPAASPATSPAWRKAAIVAALAAAAAGGGGVAAIPLAMALLQRPAATAEPPAQPQTRPIEFPTWSVEKWTPQD